MLVRRADEEAHHRQGQGAGYTFRRCARHRRAGGGLLPAGDPDSPMDPDGTRNDMGAFGGPNAALGLYELRDIDKIPSDFHLSQNYPNPFNPITSIEFQIPKSEYVALKIYNVLGQHVATLFSDKMLSGHYKYIWNASGFASGVYYYRIEAGKYVETRKMILIR